MIWTAFMVGIVGSFHCIGMCGPIVMALPTGKQKWNILLGRFLYNLGRTITYGLMGLFFGLIGLGISLAGTQQWLSILMGTIMIVSILFPQKLARSLNHISLINQFTGFIKSKFRGLFLDRSNKGLFFIGLLNGLLPCGLVYLALAGAIATGSGISGFLYMVLFGLGTIPLMFVFALAGNLVSLKVKRNMNRLIPAFVVVLGILFILRGMNLGIPYLSPMINIDASIPEVPICTGL
ncbi:MAG: sulfite exporter TauE/SafE family protein [Candidatus Cyclobacteriaceae bacterium M3_2C_046]